MSAENLKELTYDDKNIALFENNSNFIGDESP